MLPGHPDYDAARVVWNGMIDRHPAMVVRPTDAGDVMSAVGFARDQDMVIDLSRMRGAAVDPAAREARVNGGALLEELDRAAQRFGLACPVGVVATPGSPS